jgi:hypothetical protein
MRPCGGGELPCCAACRLGRQSGKIVAVKNKNVFWLGTCVAAFLLLTGAAYGIRHTPVLLHVFAETDCACGDFHEEVTGLILLNPFRDTAPEKSAAKFLETIRRGQCPADDSICRGSLDRHRASDWRLAYRRQQGGHVMLYYKLTKYGATEPEYRLSGEGLVEVEKAGDGWKVVNYSSYF